MTTLKSMFAVPRRFKKATATVVTVAALFGATPAHAFDTVWDPGVNATLSAGFSSVTTAIVTELQLILAYLMGTTTGGNGLVETISSINDKLGRANADVEQGAATGDSALRRNVADQMIMNNMIARTPTNTDGCSEMAFSGGRGAASGGSAAVKSTLQAGISEKMIGTHDQLGNMAQIVKSRPSLGFCMPEDISTGRGGCSAVGTMPGGDINTTSLTTGAVAPNTPTNQSLTAAQQTAAQAVIRNIVTPFPPEQLTKSAEGTVNGGKYMAMMYVMAARASAAADALTSIASMRYANPGLSTNGVNSATGNFDQTWADGAVQTKYKQFFPSQAYPTQPSEWEMLRYDIFSRYADATDSDSWQAKVATFTTEESLREIARMDALQLRLSELQIERQEDTNKMLAAMISQSLQPVTNDSLHEAYSNASVSASASK